MAYDQVNRALANLGQGITTGFRDLSAAKMSAAEFALREAQTVANLEERRMKLPIIKQQVKQATNYLERQDWLDQPLRTNEVMSQILGANPQDHTVRHIFENDIPGHILKTTGIKYDKENDLYIKPNGMPASRRDFERAMPAVHAVLVARTDPYKMGQDLLEAAQARGDKNAIAKLSKNVNNPQWLLQQYDKQEQYLINAKAGMIQFGYNTGTIDDSLTRLDRKRSEILANLKLDKTLAAKNQTLKPEITQKDKAAFYMQAYEIADKRMDAEALTGKFEDWDDAKIEAYRRNLAGNMVYDAFVAAGVVQPKKIGRVGIDTSRFKGKKEPIKKGTFDSIMQNIKDLGGKIKESASKTIEEPQSVSDPRERRFQGAKEIGGLFQRMKSSAEIRNKKRSLSIKRGQLRRRLATAKNKGDQEAINSIQKELEQVEEQLK
jgi:hypothetical protein